MHGTAVTTRSAPAARLETAYVAQPAAAAAMREDLRAFLTDRDVDAAVAFDVVLAADEAFSNAIVHGGGSGRAIRVTASVTAAAAAVEVRDGGHGFTSRPPDPRPFPDVERPCGRGVFLMARVMDEVRIRSGRNGTTVSMLRRLG